MNGGLFYKFIAISKLLAISNDYFDDFIMFDNEKMMGYSVSLVGEIDELLNDGYTKEEISKIIQENDFTAKDPELTQEEGEFLKGYCLRLLDIRYKLYMETKNEDYVVIDDDEDQDENKYIKRLKK